MGENSHGKREPRIPKSRGESYADRQKNDQRVSVGVMLNQRFEIDVKVRQNARKES